MKVFIVNQVWSPLRRDLAITYMGEDEFIKLSKWRINSKSRSKKILLDLIIKSYINFGYEVIIVEGDNLSVNTIETSDEGEKYIDKIRAGEMNEIER